MTTISRMTSVNKSERKNNAKQIRKQKAKQFTHRITFRISDEQQSAIQDIVNQTGLKQTEAIRFILFQQKPAKEWIKWLDEQTTVYQKSSKLDQHLSTEQLKEIHNLAVQVKRLDNNVNQLARVANKTMSISNHQELMKQLKKNIELDQKVLGALGCHM